jgi:hypothetical protein
VKASKPPADAPIPTTGNDLTSPGPSDRATGFSAGVVPSSSLVAPADFPPHAPCLAARILAEPFSRCNLWGLIFESVNLRSFCKFAFFLLTSSLHERQPAVIALQTLKIVKFLH